jgi:prophage antirepressor-like protein
VSQVIPFNFEDNQVRVQTDASGEPWFNAADVCAVLGMSNPRQAVETHVDIDDVQKLDVIDSVGRRQLANHVNISGLYALVFGSTKDTARRFKRWVTAEVLPAIQRTGRYVAPGADAAPINLRDPRQMARAALQLVEINGELSQALAESQARVATLAPKAQAYDAMCESDGTYTLENSGRIIGSNGSKMGPRVFIEWMRNNGFLFYQDKVLVPYGKFVVQGLFKVKARDVDGKLRTQTYVTPKGLAHFHRLLNPQGDLLLINTGGAA